MRSSLAELQNKIESLVVKDPLVDEMFEAFNASHNLEDRLSTLKIGIEEERQYESRLQCWFVKADTAFRLQLLPEFLSFLNEEELNSLETETLLLIEASL